MIDEVLLHEYELNGATVAEMILNRPAKGNALTFEVLDEMGAFCRRVARDKGVRVVVLRGNGRFFCTGGDIKAWGSLSPSAMGQEWILRGIDVLEQIANLPQPVIAALHGHTLGGGLELALAADLRVAVRSAKLGMPEVGLGMIAGWGGVRKLAETVGVAHAREFLLLGAPIDAETAHRWGLVHAVAEDAAAMDAQIALWLQRLTANAPIAMALTKGLLKTMHAEMRQAFASAAAHAASTEDCKEGVQAFLLKRPPAFHNQ